MLVYKKVKTQQEIDTLIGLVNEIWPEVFIPIIGKAQVDYMLVHYQGKDVITEEIAHGKQYFIIEFESEPIGYFAFTFEDDCLYISKIYLKKEFRGKGLSSQVFDHFEEVALTNKKPKLFLRVNRFNKQAIEVYLHRGFAITKSIDEPLGGFVLNDYCMEKPLKNGNTD